MPPCHLRPPARPTLLQDNNLKIENIESLHDEMADMLVGGGLSEQGGGRPAAGRGGWRAAGAG